MTQPTPAPTSTPVPTPIPTSSVSGKVVRNFRLWTLCGLLLLGLTLLLGVQLLQLLPAWRIDLTEDGIYTLSPGSQELVENLQQPVELTFYYSAELAAQVPQLRDYARRIEDLLREYQLLNQDVVRLTVVDPEPFSEAEDAAVALGLQGAQLTLGGDTFYMGLVGRLAEQNVGDNAVESIAFFSPDREQFLEYDISRLIYRLSELQKPVLGLLTDQSMLGGFDFSRGRPGGEWVVMEQLQELLDVRALPLTTTAIDSDISVLMIVHPQQFSEPLLYAIDQFVLAGGKALIFLDPHFEGGAESGLNSSSLKPLLQAWGVSFSAAEVVADGEWGLRLAVSESGPALPHVGIFGIGETGFNRDNVITGQLETVNLASVGYFTVSPDSPLKVTPLLQSSDQAMIMPAAKMAAVADHSDLLLDFAATGERYPLALSLSGSVPSAFAAAPEDVNNAESGRNPHLSQSSAAGIHVVVVGDVDMLTDRLWVQVSPVLGQRTVVPWANNGDLVINAVEVLSGSDGLIDVRSRGQYNRPFTRIDGLRNQAAAEYKIKEQGLLARLEQLEVRIQALSNAGADDGMLVLNDSQHTEIQHFEAERLQVRRDLRQVQHQLNQSISSLQLRLKLLNIMAVPVLLLLLLAGLLIYRRRH